MKYSVDVFTPQSVGTKFPENSYEADTIDEIATLVRDCTREIAGICKIEIWINEKTSPNKGRIIINARPYTLPYGEITLDQIVEFAGFSGYKVSISVSDESNFFTNGDGNFVFKRGTEPVITVTASTPGIPFPEGHLFCDDCGKLGPKKGKQDRICFWLCEECMSGFKE